MKMNDTWIKENLTPISTSIFSPKIEKLYYRRENAAMYASIEL